MYAIAELTKESRVSQEGVLTTREGQPVQTKSVPHTTAGVQVMAAGRRLEQGDAEDNYITPFCLACADVQDALDDFKAGQHIRFVKSDEGGFLAEVLQISPAEDIAHVKVAEGTAIVVTVNLDGGDTSDTIVNIVDATNMMAKRIV